MLKKLVENERLQFLGLMLSIYVFYLVSEIKPWEIEEIWTDLKNIARTVASL